MARTIPLLLVLLSLATCRLASRPRVIKAMDPGPVPDSVVMAAIHEQVKTPYKKPKGKELTAEQEEFNRQLSAIRVRVEHCIGWVKNWAIIATRFRCAHSIYTLILRVVCGFVNMQTERWQEARAQAAA